MLWMCLITIWRDCLTVSGLVVLHVTDLITHVHYFLIEIGNCRQLLFLEVHHNDLVALPDSVGNLASLRRLGLRYNKLTELPISLCKCTQLKEIGLESNMLTSLPVRVFH